jgi:DNA-binding transcriptional LysR family regulator
MNGLPPPSLDDLALFVRVVETGGFSAAARATGRPQATVSRRIAELERALGSQLLDRTTRRIALTEAGRRVLDHAAGLHAIAEAAQSDLAEMTGAVAGDLVVTAPVILGQAVIGPILAEFAAAHPAIDLQVEWTTRAVDPLADGVDVAIQLGLAAPPEAVRMRLGTTAGRLYAPPGYAGPMPGTPDDLAGLPLATLRRSLRDRAVSLVRGAERREVEVTLRMVANDVRPVLELAEACGCLALVPDFAAPSGWDRVLPDWAGASAEVNALRTRSRGSLPKVRSLIEALREGFRVRGLARS